jgi:hypothetical protein
LGRRIVDLGTEVENEVKNVAVVRPLVVATGKRNLGAEDETTCFIF